MKKFLLLAVLALSGCVYEAPLVVTPELHMDTRALGSWVTTDEDGRVEQMTVVRLTDREYVVEYPVDRTNGMFFSAMLVGTNLPDVAQLRLLGFADGREIASPRVYQFARFKLTGEELSVRCLNELEVSDDIKTTAELSAAIEAKQTDENLFGKEIRFQRMTPLNPW